VHWYSSTSHALHLLMWPVLHHVSSVKYHGLVPSYMLRLGRVVLQSPYHLCSPSTCLSMSLRLSSMYSATLMVIIMWYMICDSSYLFKLFHTHCIMTHHCTF
jgi:hypothetical protein